MRWLHSAWLRLSLANITHRKGRTALVVLGIFVGVFGLTAINVTEETLVNAYTFTLGYQATQPDFQMTVDHLDPTLMPLLQAVPNVKAIQYVSDFSACWQQSATACNVSLSLISYPDLRRAPITPVRLISGRYPGIGEIVMEQGDQRLHRVNVGDLITIHQGVQSVQVHVVGLSRTPGANPRASGEALGYMSDTGLQRLIDIFGSSSVTTPTDQQTSIYQRHIQVSFQVTGGQAASIAETRLQQILRAHGITILTIGFAPQVTAATLNTIKGVFTLLTTLVVVAVILSALLILNTVTTLMAEQVTIIGAMKAVGGVRSDIMRGYLISVGVYSVLATVPAVGLGMYAGFQLASALAPQIPLDVGSFSVASWVIGLSVAIGIGVPVLAALPPLWNGARITVREALTAYGVSVGSERSPLARIGQRLTWISQVAWLGMRGLFRKRWRATLSLVTLSLVAACFLVVQTTTTSVDNTIGAVRASLSADMTVNFNDPTTYSQIQSQLDALPNVARVERSGSLNASTPWGTLQVYGYEPETQLYHYQLTSGRWFQPGDKNVVLLSTAAAQKTGANIGDMITLTNNYGASNQMTVTVIGTVRQTIDVIGWIGAALLPVNTLYQLKGSSPDKAATATQQVIIEAHDRSHNAVNTLATQVSAIVNPLGASKEPGYYSGQGGTIDTISEYVTRRQGDAVVLYYLLYSLALIVGVVGVLGLANSLVASVLERRHEIGLLRALGSNGRRVAEVFWIESLALGVFSYGLGAFLGVPLAYMFVRLFSAYVMPIDFTLDPFAFTVTLCAILVVASLASIAPAWRAGRLRVVDLLRYE